MSCSLIGIILVQAYYINNSIQNSENQFNFNVKKALSYVSKTIENEERSDHYYKISELIKEGKTKLDSNAILNFYIKQDNPNSNQSIIYRNGILEENFKVSSSLFDIGLDSLNVKRILSERETKIVENSTLDGTQNLSYMLSEIGVTTVNEFFLETSYLDYAFRKPIHKRVNTDQVERLLALKLIEDDINIGYEFAIYSNGLATKVKTENFHLDQNKASTFSVPFFFNENDDSNYRLLVNFPERKKFILSSVLTMLILSIVFTLIIIILRQNN